MGARPAASPDRGRGGKRLRLRAAWHFGAGPDYCRGCAALGRDCGQACPYAAHAPATAEGAALWAAGTACVRTDMAGVDLDTAGAVALAREMGATGWPAAVLLADFRSGLNAGLASRTAPTDAGGTPHGG